MLKVKFGSLRTLSLSRIANDQNAICRDYTVRSFCPVTNGAFKSRGFIKSSGLKIPRPISAEIEEGKPPGSSQYSAQVRNVLETPEIPSAAVRF
jgi:hypothetical protein